MQNMENLLEQKTATATPLGVINNVGVVNNVVAQIHIHSWGGDAPLRVPSEMIAAAFTENAQLAEYCEMGDHDKADEEKSKPYIVEALMELTKRAHVDPVYRNVYLNPNRSDQAMVCVDTKWEACPLYDVTRVMFECVSTEIRAATSLYLPERDKLPPAIQGSACYVPQMYRGNPKQYIDMAKALVVAHLANIAPTAARAVRKKL
jgi:hypothetical protein